MLSTEHGNQLERYRQRVESEFPGLLPLYILLTVDGEPPTKESDAAYYIPFSYSRIAELVQGTLDSRSSRLGIDVQSVLRQYLASLRRRCVKGTENELITPFILFEKSCRVWQTNLAIHVGRLPEDSHCLGRSSCDYSFLFP